MQNQTTRYAQFNALTVTGRIFNAEIVNYNDSEFLSVSVISTAMKDGDDLVYTFTNNNGLLKLHRSGNFCTGRQVTITGHIANVSEVYTTKSGEVRVRKQPEIKLVGVTVLEGGLGPIPDPSKKQARVAQGTVVTQVGTPANDLADPSVDETPAYADEAHAYGEATNTDEAAVPIF